MAQTRFFNIPTEILCPISLANSFIEEKDILNQNEMLTDTSWIIEARPNNNPLIANLFFKKKMNDNDDNNNENFPLGI